MFSTYRRLTGAGFFTALLISATVSQAETPQICFEQKDKACLEELYSDIVTNPTPQNGEAAYLLGQLEMEDQNYEEAKTHFEIGAMFGSHAKSAEALKDLLASGKIALDPVDCLSAPTPDTCLLTIAEGQTDKSPSAYYLLAGLLADSAPDKAATYTILSAEGGHLTSACLLAAGYAETKPDGPSVTAGFVPAVGLDYEQARRWGEECGFGPFPGYNASYFDKYLAAEQHSAYAIFKDKGSIFDAGSATPEIAASIASALCDKYSQRAPEDEPCKILSVDGEWVDYFVAPPLPEPTGTVEDLLKASARVSFTQEYTGYAAPKAFAQGPLGNWSWIARTEAVSLEEVKRIVLENCQNSWQYKKYGSACKIVNVNDEWVQE